MSEKHLYGGGETSQEQTHLFKIQVVGQVVIDVILVCFHSMIVKNNVTIIIFIIC